MKTGLTMFLTGYQLPSLQEVKTYIDQPSLPYAIGRRDQKWSDLGEMNKLLTKKVEELTLYGD